jgi:parallel beta-helix repeat protein
VTAGRACVALALALAGIVLAPCTPAHSARATSAVPADRPLDRPVHPKRQPKRLLPSQFAAVVEPRQLAGSNRNQILLRKGRIELLTGARVVWTGRLGKLGGTRLEDVYRLIRRSPKPKWLDERGPGLFVMRAAIVQAPGTRLVIAAPGVREIRMMSTGRAGQEVYLSGVSAKVTIDRARLTSWLLTGGPDPKPSIRRPFVSYDQRGSVLAANGAHFSYLGGDSILAYGVTWGRGATGSAVGSTFDHNFFGAYTNAAVGVLFRRNTFRDNDIYGLDPHTHSSRLTVDDNAAFNNGSHGIIFSEGVVDSVVTNNRAFGNRVNGIMMDKESHRNLLSGNQAWSNDGDGIVVQNSSRVEVRGNKVSGNRVGIRVTGDSVHNAIEANELVGNRRGIEIYAGPAPAAAIAQPTTVKGNRIEGGDAGNGISVKDFAGIAIAGNTVSRFTNGILLSGRSPRARISSNRLTHHIRGIEVESSVAGARLSHNLVNAATERGLVLAGAGTVSDHDIITGADIAVDIRNDTTVNGVRIRDGRRGINLVSGRVTVAAADVNVHEFGVNVDPAARLDISRSTIVADRPLVGIRVAKTAHNTTGNHPPPFRWLALAGVAFIAVAVGLHLARRTRSRASHRRAKNASRSVRNAW